MLLSRKDSDSTDTAFPSAGGTPRATGLAETTPLPGPARRPAAGPAGGQAADANSRKLIVGQGISLAGEITACDRLVVEGTVKVTLNQTRAIEITESGVFTDGKAEVEEAEISGTYAGELTVRGRLLIRATGRVNGTIRYGELEVERGGKLSGKLALFDPKT